MKNTPPLSQALEEIIARSTLRDVPHTRKGNILFFDVPAADCERVVFSLKKDLALPLKTMFATDEREENGTFRVVYVFGVPKENFFLAPFVSVPKDAGTFTSLAVRDQEFSRYEREIFTFFGLVPEGHPDLKRIILHEENFPADVFPLRKDVPWNARLARQKPDWEQFPSFKKYGGEGVYEIPVGPVHAGIIEPGHFRFSMLGEEMLALEPRLGYVHKGIEKLFENLAMDKKVALAERVSGDSSFAHALAFCQSLESLAGVSVPKRGELLRVVYAELERLANHVNDIGFIMLDTGFSFGGAGCARLRERLLRSNERLTGSRFLRGVAALGGSAKDIDAIAAAELLKDQNGMEKDFNEIIAASLESDSLVNRLEGAGALSPDVARDHGLVGPAARAVGRRIDARKDSPYASYRELEFSVPTETAGDVHARFMVRVAEVKESFALIRQALLFLEMEKSPASTSFPERIPQNSAGVGIAEGFRGDIVYVSMTDSAGALARVKVRDASFLNWQVFPYTIPADVVPDFPLINKSYNLSYSGNDL